jgi:c-di-GMP-binding flagellar brake protein YcgR
VTERRKFMRFDTAIKALCEIATENGSSASEIKNISKDGALLILAKQLCQGSEFKLSMDVPGDNIPVFASCEVAWQNSIEGGYETGVKFKSIENTDKGRLLEYIYTQWLKFLDKSK